MPRRGQEGGCRGANAKLEIKIPEIAEIDRKWPERYGELNMLDQERALALRARARVLVQMQLGLSGPNAAPSVRKMPGENFCFKKK